MLQIDILKHERGCAMNRHYDEIPAVRSHLETFLDVAPVVAIAAALYFGVHYGKITPRNGQEPVKTEQKQENNIKQDASKTANSAVFTKYLLGLRGRNS